MSAKPIPFDAIPEMLRAGADPCGIDGCDALAEMITISELIRVRSCQTHEPEAYEVVAQFSAPLVPSVEPIYLGRELVEFCRSYRRHPATG